MSEIAAINVRPITSEHWRLEVDATREVKIFDTYAELVKWCQECRRTFMDNTMTFTATHVRERSGPVRL